jgi:HD-like signal output (HDOD) protein
MYLPFILENARQRPQLLYESERDALGFTHAVLGGLLLQNWKLPTSLEEIVMYHHNPTSATRFPVETAIVHLADIIVHSMRLGTSGESYVPPLDPAAWDKLGLHPSALTSVEEQVDRQYHDSMRTMMADA